MSFIAPPAHGLAETAYARVLRQFAGFIDNQGQPAPHVPSAAQKAAIKHLLDTFEAAANGTLSPHAHVSAIPPGTGKSVSIQQFAMSLMDDRDRVNVGMLILVGRIAEAADMATVLAAYRDRLCVLTSDFRVNSLGTHRNADNAQCCVTTQEALRRAVKAETQGRGQGAEKFTYRGQRRAVVSWDEALSLDRPVILDPAQAAGLTETLLARASNVQGLDKEQAENHQADWRGASDALYAWASECGKASHGSLVDVPDLSYFVPYEDLEAAVAGDDKLSSVVDALRVVSGDKAKVNRSGYSSVIVTHTPEIPRAIMPVVITDASAEVNSGYKLMEARGLIRRLTAASKSYSKMTIRLVPMTASRSVFRKQQGKQAKVVLSAVVDYIRSVPDEEVLVIGYTGRFPLKDERAGSLEDALRNRLTEAEQGCVRWLTYGQHTSTNRYRHVRRIVLMGLNFTSQALHVASTAAASGLDLVISDPSDSDVIAMRSGMLMDTTLQAVLRGHARLGQDGQCGECEVVVFQTRNKGLTDDQWCRVYEAGEAPSMFPGALLVHDKTLAPLLPLSKNMKALSAILERRMRAGETTFSNLSLYKELGIGRPSYFKMVKKDAWRAHYRNLGLEIVTLSPNGGGYRCLPA